MARPKVGKDFKRMVKHARGNSCEYCGAKRRLTIHHSRYPLSKYPNDAEDPERVVVLCKRCHNEHHRMYGY